MNPVFSIYTKYFIVPIGGVLAISYLPVIFYSNLSEMKADYLLNDSLLYLLYRVFIWYLFLL